MVIEFTVLDIIKKKTVELEEIKKDLQLYCKTIDYILSQRALKSKPQKDKKKTGRNKISKEVEELMTRVLSENINGAKITALYNKVETECLKLEWDVPSQPTFTRRYHKFNKKKPAPLISNSKGPEIEIQGPIEKVNVKEIKEKLKESRLPNITYAEDQAK